MKIKNCRACGSKNIKKAFSLNNQFLTGIFPKSKKDKISKGRLDLVFCQKCTLLQLNHSFDANEMYGNNYGYMSSLNSSMADHFKNKIPYFKKYINLQKNDLVIDIGSNDGTFLSFFNKKLNLVGVDPTISKFKKYYKKHIRLVPDFFSYEKVAKEVHKKKAKLITSIAMFYDLENPIKFASDIYKTLSDDGIWHLEQSYLPSMIKNFSYDTICHEHIEYYSLKSIKYIIEKANLKILDVKFNNINGGSFSLTVAKKNSQLMPNKNIINWLLYREKLFAIDKLETYKKFFIEINKNKKLLKNLLINLKKDKKKVAGYGASTKGNVILQYCNINSKLIENIYEVNKFKFNRYTPGTNIKIISEKKIREKKPDYLLVLPWHFKDFILNKEKKYLSNGGKLIFPLPEIEIV